MSAEVSTLADTTLFAGVDEAGRGPLAGPVVVAAVVFPPGRTPVNGLDDSKQLDEAHREKLFPRIVDSTGGGSKDGVEPALLSPAGFRRADGGTKGDDRSGAGLAQQAGA